MTQQPSLPERAEAGHRSVSVATCIAAGTLLLLMAVPYFRGEVYVKDDLLATHLPFRAFYARCLSDRNSFDWMPELYCGFYLTGEGQAGSYHPLHLLLYGALPLRAAFTLELLLSYPFLFAGTSLFLRRHGVSTAAALFGALAFTFSGFNLLHFVHPNAIAVVAHIPWLLYLIDCGMQAPLERRSWQPFCGIALLTASQLLLGYPQYVWFSLLAEATYVLAFYPPWRGYARTGLRLALAKCLGLAIGGVQIVPTWDALRNSLRAGESTEFANLGYLHPGNIIQLFNPYLFQDRVLGANTHEFTFYCGSAPFVILLWYCFRRAWRGSGNERLAAWAAGLGVGSMLLSWGPYGGIYYLQAVLPLVGRFRVPARFSVLAMFSMGVVVALALDAVLRVDIVGRLRRFRTSSFTAKTLLFTAVMTIACVLPHREWLAGPLWTASGPVLIGIACVILGAALRGSVPACVLLVLLTAVDLGAYGLSYAVLNDTQPYASLADCVKTPPGEPDGRVVVEQQLVPGRPTRFVGNQVTLFGWREAGGYSGLIPRRALIGEHTSRNGLRAAGVKWVLAAGRNKEIPGLQPGSGEWLRVEDPLPRFRFLSRARISRDPAEEIQRIDPTRVALVDEELSLDVGAPGRIVDVDDRPGRIRLTVSAPTRQLLVVAESHHPGWIATVDGRERTVQRVYGQFLGCVVEPGESVVEWTFAPASLTYGKWISAGGLLMLAACCIVSAVVGRRRATRPMATKGGEEQR